MIDSILELVLGNLFEVTILILVALLLGILISALYWRGEIEDRESQIRARAQEIVNEQSKEISSLNTQLKNYMIILEERERGLDVLSAQLKDSETLLNEREKRIDFHSTQLDQRENRIQGLNQQVQELDKAIELLQIEVADLEEKNRASVIRAEGAEENVMGLENLIEEKVKEVSDLEELNRELLKRAESAEIKIVEVEKSLEEKEQETTTLKDRMRFMQDDLTLISGIGPKVSSMLRLAGINTFAKLASSEVDKITDILKAENPNLLRLTDPSTWPEQAKLASEKDWDGLSTLQERLKGSSRT